MRWVVACLLGWSVGGGTSNAAETEVKAEAAAVAAAPAAPLLIYSHASFRPYAYFENGEPRGLAMDVLREVSQRMGRPLDIMPLEVKQAEERVARGQGDGSFPTLKFSGMEQTFAFSDPAYDMQFTIFSPASRPRLASVSDLRGLRVGVTATGFGRQVLHDEPQVTQVLMNDYAHGFALLQAREVDALIADRWVGASEINMRKIPNVRAASEDVAVLPAMLMLRRGNEALLGQVNDALRSMRADGTLAQLLEQWRPEEVVYVPPERINWHAVIAGFAILGMVLAVMIGWTIILRQEVALRRQRESEVAALHQRLAIATQAGGIGIWDWDVVGDRITFDQESYRLYAREDAPGGPSLHRRADWLSWIHPEDRARVDQEVTAALSGMGALDTEFRLARLDGEERFLHAHAETVRDPAGGAVRMIGIMQDVTARRQAAATIAEAAERLRVALAASRRGIWRQDLRTNVTEWDMRTREILDLAADDHSSSLPDVLLARIVEEDRAAVRQAWTQLRHDGEPFNLRFRLHLRDEALRHVEIHGIVHAGVDGRPEWIIGVAGDVTEVVRAAEEAGHLRDQLLQAQKMETLGTLAAGIAHDFNNLLTGINGFVELSAGSVPPGHEVRDFLRNARQGVTQASDLVRRILQFSRRSAGSQRTPVHVEAIVRDTVPLISRVLPPNVLLQFESAVDGLAPVLADPVQLQQVLMNLCVNAAHAIGAERGTVRVVVEPVNHVEEAGKDSGPAGLRAGQYVRLRVVDTGCGMDDATLQKIFDPFFTTRRRGEGTGLGLAVVKGIVADHAGTLHVTSEVGKGSAFEVYLPAVAAEEPAPLSPAEVAPVRGEGRRVLVVDDEPAVVDVARLALMRAGYVVETRTSPAEAWQLIAAAPARFEVLLVDLQMPEMPGTELIRRVRGLPVSLPVVLMSGQFERVDITEVIHFGAVALLEKPFDIATLARTVDLASQPGGERKVV